jgi:hypothetical protein
MPKPPAPPQHGLDEVERAISVLEGRHPEHERTRRETMAAADERRVALEKELASNARRRRRRTIVIAANAIALVAAGVVGWRLVVRARAIRAALDEAEAPFATHGLTEIASNELAASRTLEVEAPASSCFVAVATSGPVRVHAGPMAIEAIGSAGWCACGAERVTLESGGPYGGLALLRIDARAIGGTLARPWVPFAPAEWGDRDGACREASLDAWIADQKWPRPAIDDQWFDEAAARGSLQRAGFRVVSGVEAERPFGVVQGAAGDCLLAIAQEPDVLTLRGTGGVRRIAAAHGALAWCDSAGVTMTVWREGKSPAVVLAAPATRVGGLLGTRESAAIAGTPVAADATWLRDEDLAWDARSLLQASATSGVESAALPSESGPLDGRVAAIVSSGGASLAWQPPTAVVACDPPLDAADHEPARVCASTVPVSWWRKTEAAASAARAPLPFWLSSLDARHEPDAIASIPHLLALARRLARYGFEPTIEGVTELTAGVRVVGRAGEDAIVAVGLGPKAPWVFPYSDDVPWDLGDPPRIVNLQPGEAVKLVSSPPPSSPVDKRRTVVFRHAKRP